MPDGSTGRPPAIRAHILLIVLTLLPLFVPIPYQLSIVLHATLTILAGSWRSVKPQSPTEQLTNKEAAKFPLIGSIILVSLFVAFKFYKELANKLLSIYLGFISLVSVVATLLPYAEAAVSSAFAKKQIKPFSIPALPVILKEPIVFEPSVLELLLALPAGGLVAWYFSSRHWVANNALGLCFSLVGIEHLNLGSFQTASILLGGLFFYDIFWVFCTPVMVGVAQNFEAPIKLLFPRGVAGAAAAAASGKQLAMLGLGDIVIPGAVVALMLRYDLLHKPQRANYFLSASAGYIVGLATTIFIMTAFKAAQPALLYIVPTVLLAIVAHAAARGELREVLAWKEPEPQPEEAVATVTTTDAVTPQKDTNPVATDRKSSAAGKSLGNKKAH